ncbi:MAG TPA: hypothetical protein DCO68_01930 [Methylophilaceae bacterium]|nr:hypothetical protein [Methylophilaceae bacterium]HAJ70821.1 hypothetical protein [Methylophilaceae bacterium]
MKTSQTNKCILIAAALAFFMLLTRGSHMLTPFSLPDASIALFLLGGLWLKRAGWFAAFFVLATCIDFGAAAFDPAQGFCLTNGYWGLIPSYGVMWLGGIWLSKQDDAFNAQSYALVALSTTFTAFVISTQTYYLFSGRFPAQGLIESMKHGWEYLPSWMGYAGVYFAIVWLTSYGLRSLTVLKTAKE